MVTVEYKGRLGNQLFQYCFGRILAERLGYRLNASPIPGFPGTGDVVHGDEFKSKQPIRIEKNDRPILRELLSFAPGREVVINAYLQRYAYYASSMEQIRYWLRLDHYDPQPYQTDDLVLNIRLGDYLKLNWVLLPSFYTDIIDAVKPVGVTIVTDSPRSNYLRHFDQYSPRIIHEGPLEDFKWLVNAKRLVISQSSFSWWGAILSNARVWMPETTKSNWSAGSPVDLRVRDNPNWFICCTNPIPRGHQYVEEE